METSRIESGNQASIPPDVRAALGVQPGDTISWTIENGEVKVAKADATDIADVGFENVLVPTPEGFTAEGGVAALAALSEEERLGLLQREIEKGRASGASKRSFDDIVKSVLGRNG
jgi:bifunctional DNA-binding transcriptional regulator/antitoxin component of YhaV-PrlF toxin-antitoxin module